MNSVIQKNILLKGNVLKRIELSTLESGSQFNSSQLPNLMEIVMHGHVGLDWLHHFEIINIYDCANRDL